MSSQRRGLAPLVLVLLLLGPLLPAEALHLAELPRSPHLGDNGTLEEFTGIEVPETPSTGFSGIDAELERLRRLHDEEIDGLNRELAALWGTLEEPPVTAAVDLLRDPFDEGARHGGLGDWELPEGWDRVSLDDDNATLGFGDPANGSYETGADAILLTPVIDLGTLAGIRSRIPRDRGDVVDDPTTHLYHLYLVHRFAFAEDEAAGPFDGGRVEVFRAGAPLDEGGEHVSPREMPFERAREGFPLRVRTTTENDTAAFAGEPSSGAFTGESGWRVDAFDLSRYAGMSIRIGFRVKTLGLGESIFDRESGLFSGRHPPGWYLGHVEVRAPALPYRVVAGDPLSPLATRFEAGIAEPAPGPVRFQVPVWNLGSEDTTVVLDHVVEQNETRRVLDRGTRRVEMPAGSVHVVNVTVPIPEELEPARQVVTLKLAARPEDATERELQRLEGIVGADPGLRTVPARVHQFRDLRSHLSAKPLLADPGETRRVSVHFDNRGNAEERVVVDLWVNRSVPTGAGAPEWILGEATKTVTIPAHTESVVRFDVRIPEELEAFVTARVRPIDLKIDREERHTLGLHSGTVPEKLHAIDPPDLLEDSIDCAADGDDPFACPAAGLTGSVDGFYWRSTDGTFLKAHLPPASNDTEIVSRLLRLGYGGSPELYPNVIAGYDNLTLDLRYSARPESILIRFHLRGPFESNVEGNPGGLIPLGPLVTPVFSAVRPALRTVEIVYPPDDRLGTSDLADSLRESWRDGRIDVSRILAEATGVHDTWRLGIEEMVIVDRVGDRTTVGIDTVNLTGVPIDRPEQGRITLLRSTAQHALPVTPSQPPPPDEGEWENNGWLRTLEAGVVTKGWKLVEDASDPHWHFELDQRGNLGNRLYYAPPEPLPELERPTLELFHEYATTPRDMDRFRTPGRFDIREAYTLQVQALPSGCERPGPRCGWSELRWLEPDGGYPKPYFDLPDGGVRQVLQTVIEPGEGFYHPKGDFVVTREGRNRVVTGNGSGPVADHFDLSPERVGMNLTGRIVRFALTVLRENPETSGPDHGWKLRGIGVYDRPLAHDLQVGPVRLEPAYDLLRLEHLGPGSLLPVRVQVNNTGFFDAEEAELQLAIEDDRGNREVLFSSVDVPAGGSINHTFLYVVPEDASGRSVTFTAEVRDFTQSDLRPWDNTCSAGLRHGACDRPTAIPILRLIDLELRQTVAPAGAPVGITRSAVLEVRNNGNAPASEVEVRRTIERIAGESVVVRAESWELGTDLPPSAVWTRLDDPSLKADHVATLASEEPMRWTPEQPGIHVVTARVEGERERLVARADNAVSTTDVARAVVFTDDFEGPGAGAATLYERVGEDLWALRTDEGFRSRSSFWVGGTEDGYPDGKSTAIELPPLDLVQARSATLSFMARYDTEAGYDGAAVHASLDGGKTWLGLEPTGGYPHAISGSSPVVPSGDPSLLQGALSGEVPEDAAVDGWLPLSFPLEQLPGLRVPEVLADLLPPSLAIEPYRQEGASFYRPGWATGDPARLERFEVYNGTLAEPRSPAGGSFWYSGSQGGLILRAVDTSVSLTLTNQTVQGEETLVLQTWDWRDGVTRLDRRGTGGTFDVRYTDPDGEVHTCSPTSTLCQWAAARDANADAIEEGPWSLMNLTLPETTLTPADTIAFTFRYRSSLPSRLTAAEGVDAERLRTTPGPSGNRGWAIDAVAVLAVRETGLPRELVRDLAETHPGWNVASPTGETAAVWSAVSGPSELTPRTAGALPVADGRWEPSVTTEGRRTWKLAPAEDGLSLPANLDSRLVSPVLDLTSVTGENVTLAVDHRYRFAEQTEHTLRDLDGSSSDVVAMVVDGGAVEVQAFNETTGRFDDWEVLLPHPITPRNLTLSCRTCSNEYPRNQARFPLTEALPGRVADRLAPYTTAVRGIVPAIPPVLVHRWYEEPGGPADTTVQFREPIGAHLLITGSSGGWRKDAFDLSPYIGKRVRVALHAWNNPAPTPNLLEPEGWEVRDLEVSTEIVKGGPVSLRLVFGSDSSVGGRGLGIDDLRIGREDYARNLAVVFDEGTVPSSLPPGRTFWVNGTVENRGASPRSGFGVRLTPGLAERDIHVETMKDSVFREEAAGPFAVAPGGEPGSSVDFSFRVRLDRELPRDVRVPFDLRVVQGSGETPPDLIDEVAGNKRVEFGVLLSTRPRLNLTLEAFPLRTEQGDPLTVSPTVQNVGPWRMRPVVYTNITRDGEAFRSERAVVELAPGEETTVPPGGLALAPDEPGLYEVQVTAVNGTTRARNATTFAVGRSFDLFGTSLEGGELGELRAYTVSAKENCNRPVITNGDQPDPSKPPHQWSVTDAAAHTGEASALFGSLPGRGSYRAFSDSALETPPLDGSPLGALGVSIFHQPQFGPGDGAVVELRLVDKFSGQPLNRHTEGDGHTPEEHNCERATNGLPTTEGWFLLKPRGGYDALTESEPFTPLALQDDLVGQYNALGDGHPVIAGSSSIWRRTSFDLFAQGLRDIQERELGPGVFRDAKFQVRLRATSQSAENEGSGWLVDDLTITGHAIELDAGADRLPLTDGATKRYRFTVANPSPYTDRYTISLDEAATTIPDGLARVLTPELRVGPFGRGFAEVEVGFPLDEPIPSGTQRLVLTARSEADPLLSDSELLELALETVPHADLVSRLEVGGNRLEIGSTAPLGAVIVNAGNAASTATTAVFTVQRPDGSDRKVIAQVPVPPVPSPAGGGTSQVILSANWTVPRTELGPFVLGLVVDPANRVVELGEDNNGVARRVEVVPLQRPDLEILPTDVRVLDLSGSEVRSVEPFDLIEVVGTVRNTGNQPVANVRVNVFLGNSLATQASIPLIPPGAERQVSVTLFAPGNSTRISLVAQSASPELREDNNEARQTLLVETSSFATRLERDMLELAPGGEGQAIVLSVRNTGNTPRLVRVFAVDPPVEVTADPETFPLGPGLSKNVRLSFRALPSSPAGVHSVDVALERGDGAGRTLLGIEVAVAERIDHAVSLAPVSQPPGLVQLPVAVTNRGNLDDELVLRASAPGWVDGAPVSLTLAAGETRETLVPITAPNATSPGSHTVTLSVQSRAGHDATHATEVLIEPAAILTLEGRPTASGGVPVTYAVTVENVGNVPTTPFARPGPNPPGWTATLDLPAVELPPGASAEGTLRLVPDGRPGPGVLQFPIEVDMAVAGTSLASLERTFHTSVDVRPAELVLREVERTPRFEVSDGDAVTYQTSVQNLGSGPAAPVDVWLYVDEELVDHVRLEELAPHAAQVVNLTLRASSGEHAVVLAVDPQRLILEPDEEDNAAAFVLDVSGGLGRLLPVPATEPFMVLAVLAAVVLLRRRRA